MSSDLPTTSSAPGEQFETRQTSASEDYTPDPSKSLKIPPNRQALVDDIIALYSCNPTIRRLERYTPDCVYADTFTYANDRYKTAGQWFALPKLFRESKNERYEVTRNDPGLIQFKNEQTWTFRIIPKTATFNALVSLSIDPDSAETEFVRVKYHKDQCVEILPCLSASRAMLTPACVAQRANEKDYSHEGIGFSFKKWQADKVMKNMVSLYSQSYKCLLRLQQDSKEVAYFEKDKNAAKEPVRTYGAGEKRGDAPEKDFST